MPYYKDPMSYGNLYIEFFVEFPKKNALTKEKIEKVKNLLGMEEEKPKTKNKVKLIEDYHEADLNTNPEGGQGRSRHQEYSNGGGRQQVRCEQQ